MSSTSISARRAPPPQIELPQAGGVAHLACHQPQDRSLARHHLRGGACAVVDADPDRSEGGAGHPYGRRRGVCLGPEIPARLWQASAADRLDRRPLVPALPGGGLGDLSAGDDHARYRPRDLLVRRAPRGRPPPRLLCRCHARALPDLQFQGFQIQSRPAAARHPAAGRAGLSQRVRAAHVAQRHPARARRRIGADDQILGADHDRRHRARRADPSRAHEIPALARAMGCDRNDGDRDDPASDLAEGCRLRAVDLCRRCLWSR